MLQVWFQQDIVPLEIDFMKETIVKEGQGKMFWHWNVRALESLNHYLNQVMFVGNRLGKKLRKKLEGDPRKLTFGGVMVGSSLHTTATGEHSADPCTLHEISSCKEPVKAFCLLQQIGCCLYADVKRMQESFTHDALSLTPDVIAATVREGFAVPRQLPYTTT